MRDIHCEDVPKILGQHRGILDAAEDVLEFSTLAKCNMQDVRIALDKFETELREHIVFENNVFFGKLLQDMWDDGENTTHLEKFIADMKRIADVIFAFLSRYSTEESITEDKDLFYKNFGRILGILILRIESEESSDYFTDC